MAKLWAGYYGWEMKPFSIFEHTLLGANMLAREVCRRGHFFIEQYLAWEGDGEYEYTEAHATAYEESDEFSVWRDSVDHGTSTFARVIEVVRLRPFIGSRIASDSEDSAAACPAVDVG